MPELPEVETYIQDLQSLIDGRRITATQVFWPRTIAEPAVEAFIHGSMGRRFQTFARRGKYMVLGLDDGQTLIVHLRMTGKLQYVSAATPRDKHTHVVFELENDHHLHFNDTRKFGRMWLVDDPSLVLEKLGPEPLDAAFTPKVLAHQLAGRRASIKALLLDQAVLAGVGNIYADEALFLAGIHPTVSGGELAGLEIERLHAAVRTVLEKGIAARGSSLGGHATQNYVRPAGEPGAFQEEHQVFRRTDQPCLVCGAPIQRIVLAQRSTHFCPTCQPVP